MVQSCIFYLYICNRVAKRILYLCAQNIRKILYMKKKVYLSTLWIATFMVLVSTIMAHHHHHLNEICTVVEQCVIDGNENDEHTGHHDKESEENGCCIQQMHAFIINARKALSIHHSLLPLPVIPFTCLWRTIHVERKDIFVYTLLYIEPSIVLSQAHVNISGLRAPPCL